MKRYIIPFVLVSLLTACPSPVLRWIETPVDYSSLGRLAGPGGGSIVSLSFGIDGEMDLPIGTNADISGKIPILVILPEGTGLTQLIPLVTYIGKSVNPPSGLTGDFSSPVTYTVTAEDGSTRDYIVRVYEKGPSTKEIIRLTLDIPGSSPLGAEGIINQDTGAGNGAITVTVPAGTSLTNLTAHITHTGAGLIGPLGGGGAGEPPDFTFSGNFSGPTTWTVFARDESTKTYTLRVVREKDSTKEITSFNLHIAGETDIIGGEPRSDGVYPIVVLVPEDSTSGYLGNEIPSITYKGAAISPDDKGLNFNTPVRYTVSAEDGTSRDYEVQVILRHQDSECLITGFYFQNPLVEGAIDQATRTITLTVPPGTNLNGLVPEIYYRGAFVSPGSRQPKSFFQATSPINTSLYVPYTVYAVNGDRITYQVYVVIDESIPPTVDVPAGGKADVGVDTDGKPIIFVEFPTYIDNPTINIGYPGTGSTTVPLVVNTGDTYNSYNYSPTLKMIIVMPPATPPVPENDEASIDAFYFTNPAAIGAIGTTGTGDPTDPIPITVTVPYGTDPRNLTATICYTGKEIAGLPGSNPIKDTRSFTSDVTYTVNAYNGTTSKTYTVNVEAQLNTAKEITSFSFSGVTSTNAIISAYPNAEGKYPIDVTVPSSTVITNLTPVITYTGDSITTGGPDFSSSVEYTVTAENSSEKIYTVNVRKEAVVDDPQILGFYFTNPLAVGVVNEITGAITVTVPPGTNTGALTPTLYFKGVSVQPGSGTVNNFAGPVTYTVTGSTGKTRSYQVTVSATPSSTKDITGFRFPSVPDAETIIGAAPDPDGTYPLVVYVPAGTPQGSLAPVISHTGVRVSPPAGTALNFNTTQTYTVTAEDGSAKTYNVTVQPRNTDAKILTSFVFNEVPLGSPVTAYIRAVGSIDQVAKKVTVMVPYTANLTGSLIPTLTYIGKSVKEGSSGTEQTANPFTGTGKSFNGQTQTYTIYDQKGGSAEYTVQVITQFMDNVSFTGETDIVFATSAFDQQTGVITITVDTNKINGPYEWYVNGVKQAAAGSTFTLNVGNGFTPGRHEIMVSGRETGGLHLHYTARVYFTVSK